MILSERVAASAERIVGCVEITYEATIEATIPKGAQILSAEVIPSFGPRRILVWYLFDPHAPLVRIRFGVVTPGVSRYDLTSAKVIARFPVSEEMTWFLFDLGEVHA